MKKRYLSANKWSFMVGTWFYQKNVQVNIYIYNLALAHLPMGIIGEEVEEGSLFALLILLPLSLSLCSYNDLGYDPHLTLSRLIHANCPSQALPQSISAAEAAGILYFI